MFCVPIPSVTNRWTVENHNKDALHHSCKASKTLLKQQTPQSSEEEIDVSWQIKLSHEHLSLGAKCGRVVVIQQVHVNAMLLHQVKSCSKPQTVHIHTSRYIATMNIQNGIF